MALAAITPTGQASIAANSTSQNVAIPLAGTPTQVLVTNLGNVPAYVALGNSSVAVTVANGTPILPNNSLPLTLGANTNLAAITAGTATSLRVTAGT